MAKKIVNLITHFYFEIVVVEAPVATFLPTYCFIYFYNKKILINLNKK